MHHIFKHPYTRYGLFGLGGCIILLIVTAAMALVWSAASGSNLGYATKQAFNESGFGGYAEDMVMEESYAISAEPALGRALIEPDFVDSAYYPSVPSVPTPAGFTSGLETYETTSYNLHARTRQFEPLCNTLEQLKERGDVHFKYLNTGLNYCDARFFVEETQVTTVLTHFEQYDDVEFNRNTESVTRHKEQLENQSDIVRQQLLSVEATLAEATVAYDEIVAFARANRDAATLSEAIREKLSQIDYLTQRKINLTSQLDNLAQRSVDLAERLEVVEFYVSVQRSNPVEVGRYDSRWEQAWQDLRDRFNGTLIGLTAFFGIFLLYAVQYGLYLLVLIVAARFGWNVVRKIWTL